ncbi:PAS domain S-box protein [Fulvimarina sp. MAC8]|uniref:sensor histidine kinase n=1 Tax=Fulvimarina sp. MAC8 TaxID=3162874 RepID=UPI0032EBFC45
MFRLFPDSRAAVIASILDRSSEFAIFATDIDGNITFWNSGAEVIFGWSESEAVDRSVDLIAIDEQSTSHPLQEEMEAVLSDDSASLERWFRRKDGSSAYVTGSIFALSADGPENASGFLVVASDKTFEFEARQRLTTSEERLQLALTASGMVGVWDYHVETDLVFADENFARIYSVDPERVIEGVARENYVRALHPDDREKLDLALAATIDRGEPFSCEYRLIQKDGSIRWVLARGGLVPGPEGGPRRLPGVVVDITERKQAEERREILARELQHRIKNILAVVSAIATQTFRGAASKDEAIAQFSARLRALGRAQDALMQADLISADFREAIAAAVLPHMESADSFRISGPPLTISASIVLSATLLVHELATNAVKYGSLSRPGGYVDIRWETHDVPTGTALEIVWSEFGGPPPVLSERRGFGSRLIRRGLGADANSVTTDYRPTGLVCTIKAVLPPVPTSHQTGFKRASPLND